MSDLIVTTQKDLIVFDSAQLDLIKRTIAKDATNEELELFLYQCKRTGLDPLARQIHFQKFVNNKTGEANVSFITTIDGYRLIADRTGVYAGSNEPVFDGKLEITDRGQYDKIAHAPVKATVTVLKLVSGILCEFSASAYWQEYYPYGTRGHMWRKMPHVMLGKCAEAQALRKAFPADLSGVYIKEEMEQANIIDGEFDEVKTEIKTEVKTVKQPTKPSQPKQVPVQPKQPQNKPVAVETETKEQTPKEWLEAIEKPKYSDIQAALLLTGKFENESFAFDMIKAFPHYPIQHDEHGNELVFVPAPNVGVSQKSALLIFDWCLSNDGKGVSNA